MRKIVRQSNQLISLLYVVADVLIETKKIELEELFHQWREQHLKQRMQQKFNQMFRTHILKIFQYMPLSMPFS